MHLLDSDIEVNARRSRCSRSGEDAARGAPPEERAAGASPRQVGQGGELLLALDSTTFESAMQAESATASTEGMEAVPACRLLYIAMAGRTYRYRSLANRRHTSCAHRAMPMGSA